MKTTSVKQKNHHPLIKWAALCVVLPSIFLCITAFAQEAEEWKAPPGADKMKNPYSGKAAPDGKTLYEKNCTQCHGPKGKGDGPKAEELEKEPQDISTAKFNEQSDGSIFWKITEGKKPMPSFNLELTEDQRWQLVNYLRELGNKEQKK